MGWGKARKGEGQGQGEREWGREGIGMGRRKHPFANHTSQAMKIRRRGACQVHFKAKRWGGVSVTQGRYLWKMTACKYLNLGQACTGGTGERSQIGHISSQHLLHQDMSSPRGRLDGLGRKGSRGAHSAGALSPSARSSPERLESIRRGGPQEVRKAVFAELVPPWISATPKREHSNYRNSDGGSCQLTGTEQGV